MMNLWIFLQLCGLGIGLSNASTAVPSITWNAKSVTVRQGENISLTCEVSELEVIDVIRISLRNSDGIIRTIADNKYIKVPFSLIPRYGVIYDFRDYKGYLTIAYQNIRGEDTGSLLCEKLPNKENFAEVKVHVQVPVKEIHLNLKKGDGNDKLISRDKIVLRQMEDNELECVAVVDGGKTLANLKITIGGEDKTEFFIPSEELKIIQYDDDDHNIFGHYYSQFKLTYSTMNPMREFNGLLLTCAATVEGFHDVSKSALIHVEYGPVIICSKYEYYARLGGSVNVVCEIRANPVDDHIWSMDIIVNRKPTRKKKILLNDDNFQLSERIIQSDQIQLMLKIHSVQEKHYTNYYLSAENKISSNEITLILHPTSYEENKLRQISDGQLTYLLREALRPETLHQAGGAELSMSWSLRNSQIVMVILLFLCL